MIITAEVCKNKNTNFYNLNKDINHLQATTQCLLDACDKVNFVFGRWQH